MHGVAVRAKDDISPYIGQILVAAKNEARAEGLDLVNWLTTGHRIYIQPINDPTVKKAPSGCGSPQFIPR